MARKINVNQIDDYMRRRVSILVRAATLEADRRLKMLTPVDSGDLKIAWQIQQEEFKGVVYNNLPYAAPVIAGRDLPPSWGGQYRTKQNASPFLFTVQKDIQTYVLSEAERISRSL